LDRIAVAWAERAREHYRGGRVDEACAAAKLAVAAHERFGSKWTAVPQLITACKKLIEQYGEET